MPNTVLKSEQLVRLAPPDDLPLAREAVFEFERERAADVSLTCGSRRSQELHEDAFRPRRGLARRSAGSAARRCSARWATAMKPQLQPPAAKPQGEEKNEEKRARRSNSMIGGDGQRRYAPRPIDVPDVVVGAWPKGLRSRCRLCGGPLVPSFETEWRRSRRWSPSNDDGASRASLAETPCRYRGGGLPRRIRLDRTVIGRTGEPRRRRGWTLADYKTGARRTSSVSSAPTSARVAVDQPRAHAHRARRGTLKAAI